MMMKKWTGIVATILAITGILIGVIGVTTGTEVYHLPKTFSDIWRMIVMCQAGLSLGFAALIAYDLYTVKIDPRDEIIREIAIFLLSYVMFVIFAGLQIASLLGKSDVSWRTPLAFIAFAISNIGQWGLSTRVRKFIAKAKTVGAQVKLTMLDTSKPGPDIDLTNDKEVQ